MPDVGPYTRKPLPPDGVDYTPHPPAPYVELGLASCFSFLRGASAARDLMVAAWEHGYDALGIADWNTMAGVVQHHVELAQRPHLASSTRLKMINKSQP